jgi:Ser/Thr protein kinase RdoA (MazF antagonist)
MHEQWLPGGKTDGAVLVGGTVRRSAGPWTPAVHALLEHLASAGFPESPRPLGSDDHGREMLGYIPGETVGDRQPAPGWAWTDATLVGMGELLRRYHDAVADFIPPSDAAWRFGGGSLRPGEIVCHNDIGPYNIVWSDGIVGLIDWDFAGPAEPVWDLAYTAWTFTPLHHPDLIGPLRRSRAV